MLLFVLIFMILTFSVSSFFRTSIKYFPVEGLFHFRFLSLIFLPVLWILLMKSVKKERIRIDTSSNINISHIYIYPEDDNDNPEQTLEVVVFGKGFVINISIKIKGTLPIHIQNKPMVVDPNDGIKVVIVQVKVHNRDVSKD